MILKLINESFGNKYANKETLDEASEKMTNLAKALFDANKRLKANYENNIKVYEATFQDVIEKQFPEKSWWEVTDCDIFGSLFRGKDPELTITEILKGVKKEFKEDIAPDDAFDDWYFSNDDMEFVDTRKGSIVRGDDDYGYDEYDVKSERIEEKPLTEAKLIKKELIGGRTFDIFGKKVYVQGELSDTRDYRWEDIRIEDGSSNQIGFGRYKWLNRPWQRFTYAEALRKALIDAFGYDHADEIDDAIDSSNSAESALKKLEGTANESIKEAKTHYGDTTIEDYVKINFTGKDEDKEKLIAKVKEKANGKDYFNGLNMSIKDWENLGKKFGLSMKRNTVTEDTSKEWKPNINFKHIKDVLTKALARGKYVNNEREEVLAAMDKADKGGYTPEQRKFIRDSHKEMWAKNRGKNESVKSLKEKEYGKDLTEGKSRKSKKKLTEGTSNFWSMAKFPLLIFDDYDSMFDRVETAAVDNIVDQHGKDYEYSMEELEDAMDKVWEQIDYCLLDESEQEELKDQITDFVWQINNDDRHDPYEEPNVNISIKPGYYEAAQIYVDNEKQLSDWQVEEINNFLKEIKDDYGLTQLGVAWRASSGETGYKKITEARGNYGHKPPFWYFTTHGTGLGTIPKDVHLLADIEGQNEKGTWGDYIALDGVLTYDELKQYDLKELAPKSVPDSVKADIAKQLGESLNDENDSTTKYTTDQAKMLDELAYLLSTEYGAIEWYDEAISKIKASGLSAEDEEALIQGIEEIRHDEEHHAFHLEKLAELVKNKISVAQADKIHESKNLKEDTDEKDVIKFSYEHGIGYTTENDLQNMLDKSGDHFWFTDDIKNISNGKVRYGWTLPIHSVKKFFGFDEFTDRVAAYQAKLNNSMNEAVDKDEFYKLIIKTNGNPSIKDLVKLGYSEGTATEMVTRLSSKDRESVVNSAKKMVKNESLTEAMLFKPMTKAEAKEFYDKIKSSDLDMKMKKIVLDDLNFFTDNFEKDYGKKKVEESFKDLERDLGKDFRKIELEDDGSETGGIAFAGETLGDFLENDLDDNYEFTLDELNKVLKDCGIKPLKKRTRESLQKPRHKMNESYDDIRIYMNTWANYNENGADLSAYGIESIADGWLTVDEAIDFAEEHAEDEPFINDTDGVPFEISEYDNAVEILEQLKELQESNVDEDIVAAIIEEGGYDIKEAIKIAEDGNYTFISCDGTDSDLGWEYIDQLYGADGLGEALGDRITDYIDEDAMRRDYEDDVRNMMYDDADRDDARAEIAEEQGIEEDEVSEEDIDEWVENWVDENLDSYLDSIIEDEIGMAERGDIDLSTYFDYEAFGRDLRIGDGFTFVDGGAISVY